MYIPVPRRQASAARPCSRAPPPLAAQNPMWFMYGIALHRVYMKNIR